MLIPAHKLKRDYIITWTDATFLDEETFGSEYTKVITDCLSEGEAFEQWYETLEYDYEDLYIDQVELTHQDRINAEVYELVLAELFDGDIGIYVEVDVDEIELAPELEGLEKILVEHQAQLKFERTRNV